MSFVFASPHVVSSVATGLANVESSVTEAQAVFGAPITSMAAAADDEVSQAIARLFSGHGQAFTASGMQAAGLVGRFAQAVSTAAGVYGQAESSAVSTLGNGVHSMFDAVLAPLRSALPAATVPELGLIVGGSSISVPQWIPGYISNANALFIQRILPGAQSFGVFTPEGLSPIYSGVKSLTLDASVAQGRFMLDTYIQGALKTFNIADTVAVYGESQSSTIAGFVMQDLQAAGIPANDVKFTLVGNPSNPDGGLLERFNGLTLPSLGITFSGATPPDTPYQTQIWTQQYDGFADFPKYPINFLADLNAFLGIQYVHPTYRGLTDSILNNAIQLPTTHDYHGDTTYYMIPESSLPYPHNYLPLLRPLLDLPVIGKPLADLLQPDLSQIVNLGYSNPMNLGWDSGQANVPTTFGLFPPLSQIGTALGNMGPGAQQGFNAMMHDFSQEFVGAMAQPVIPLTNPWAPLTPTGHTSAPSLPTLPSPVNVVNAVTGSVSAAYSTLLPMADLATALGINMPMYDATLFVENLTNPLYAIGLPVAADVGLVTLAGGIAAMVGIETVEKIGSEFASLL